MKQKRNKATLSIGLASAVLLAAAALDVRLRLVRYVCSSEKVTAPVRLVQISDLHSCAYGDEQTRLLTAVRQQKPDAVVFTGDIVDDRMPTENSYLVMETLAKEYPCFYVTGNHEHWGGQAEAICQEVAARGVTLLRGETEVVTLNGQSIRFCGIDDPEGGRRSTQLAQVGATLSEECYSVLLAHRPEEIERYLEYPFDLILSGHAHGGQWRIPGLLNGLLAPNQGLFPAYAGGRFDCGDTVFLVSRGLARESTRVPRIFNRPELVTVEICPTEE